MVYKFRLISDEVEDFLREIKLDSDATFLDLHKAILKSTGYKDDQMTSFFTCDDRWEKEIEITLEDMDSDRSDEDTYVMKDTRLSELLEDERQKLIYVFDPLTERVFFMELAEIITGKRLDHAVISRKEGTPPPQTVDFDDPLLNRQGIFDLDDDLYDPDEYDEQDLLDNGLDFTQGNPYDDTIY